MELQIVELHFRQAPRVDYIAVKERAETILGYTLDAPKTTNKTDDVCLFFHTGHIVKYAEGEVPAQTAVLSANKPIDLNYYSQDIQQSWASRNAESLLEGSTHTLIVTEMMARGLEPKDRIQIFHGVLQALIEKTAPSALAFKHSQQVIEPASYLDSVNEAPIYRPGSLNVRFFNISNSDGDMVMDTRGLQEIGLHDLQCHYRDLDPNDVSRLLYNSAVYIFENGPVIESGNTIEGHTPGSKWICQFENSLIEPNREILDLNPGSPYSAGSR